MTVRARHSVVSLAVLVAFAALAAPAAIVQAGAPKYLTKDTFFQMESIQGPEVSAG